MRACIAQNVLVAVSRLGRINRAPQARRPIGGDLEAIAPRAGVGEIAAIAIAAPGFEIVRRGEHDEALRPGEAFERNAGAPAHRAAPAIGADQIGGAVLRDRAAAVTHLHRDRVRALRHIDYLMIEQHFDVRERAQTVEQKSCSLELLALHDKGMPRVVLKNGVIELRDQLLAWPVPELKDRRDQANARHVGVEVVLGEEIKRGWMRGRGPRVGLQAAIIIEQPDGKPAAAKEPGAKQSDRSAAGDQDSALVIRHARSLANRFGYREKFKHPRHCERSEAI
jgi:hypothetical protein